MIKSLFMRPRPTFTRTISESEWTWTILSLAILFGAFVRILPALLVDFPINDGGMFAVMMNDLRAAHWVLPVETTYNFAHLPFAYPPLGLYMGALFQSIGFGNNFIFLWLPAVLSILILGTFYFFALEFLKSRPHAAVATAFLSLSPGTYVWYLMGGGLTRALGTLFFLIAITFTLRAFQSQNQKALAVSSLFCALAILTHPQAALLTLTGCAVLFFFYSFSLNGTIKAAVIVIGTVLLSSFWWLAIINNHDFSTLISGSQSGRLYAPLATLLNSLILRQTILPFTTFFWIIGFVWLIYKQRFDILLLGIILFFIDQRSAPVMALYVFSLWAAYGYMEATSAILAWIKKRTPLSGFSNVLFNSPAFSLGLLGIIFYLFVECVFHANVIVKLSLSHNARDMMAWVGKNSPEDTSFLIITGRQDAMTDPVQEWFPVLAKRHSETTLQGLEWVLAERFNPRWDALDNIQGCDTAECVISESDLISLKYSMVVLDSNVIPVSSFQKMGYEVLYKNDQYAILK